MPDVTVTHTTTINVPAYGIHLNRYELIELVKRTGSHFFDADTMRYFKSRLHDIYAGPDGWYFITSEKHEGPGIYGHRPINELRQYIVRRLAINEKGDNLDITEYNGFQLYPTLQRARTVAKFLAKSGATLCKSCHVRIHNNTVDVCDECFKRQERKQAEG